VITDAVALTPNYQYFATTPRGIEPMLVKELEALEADQVLPAIAGVSFQGDLKLGYRACLWLRTASRILMQIASFPADSPESLYEGIRAIRWSDHMASEGTLAIDFQSLQSKIHHTRYGALKVKDAIVDQFRENFGHRPSVDLTAPDLRIHVYVNRNQATVSLDLSGQSLHRRGYRQESGLAPLKENLAAAILLRSGWAEIAKAGGGLMDPMCGSGTLPIEAAFIAADLAPGLLRQRFGFHGWRQHQPALWEDLIQEAGSREAEAITRPLPIVGYDADATAIRHSLINLEKAGLSGLIHFEKRDLDQFEPHARLKDRGGLVVLNPPYGERMGTAGELPSLYRRLGKQLRREFCGWQVALFTGNIELAGELELKPTAVYPMFNGSLECRLFHYRLSAKDVSAGRKTGPGREFRPQTNWQPRPEVTMFTHRLQKNLKRLKSWRKSEGISCFRAYDQDIPEYAVAVDIYERWVLVHEYQAPASIDVSVADARLNDILAVLPETLQVPPDQVFLKIRSRQTRTHQYRRLESTGRFFEVTESGMRFRVNFTDYIDTGLFLDHRRLRQLIGKQAAGKRFLNLFAYTGTATVYAACGGAETTTSVDKSSTYLDWARKNMQLNDQTTNRHQYHCLDCLQWLRKENGQYDLVFLDPPTFSNVKKQQQVFDVQRDHVELIRLTMAHLSRTGVVIFSNHFKSFKLDEKALSPYRVQEITVSTRSPDFDRKPNMHRCWEIRF